MREEGEIVCAQAKTSQTRLLPGCKIETNSNRRWIFFRGVFRSQREHITAARQTEQKGVCCLFPGVGREAWGCLCSCPGWLGPPRRPSLLLGWLVSPSAVQGEGAAVPAWLPLTGL